MKLSRLERVLKLLVVLQSGRLYRPGELAEQLGVSRRTVFRDLDVLYHAGIPCYYDEEQQGYRINGNFFLPPMNLKLSEALSLLLVAQQAGGAEGLPLTASAKEAALKIECALPSHIRQHCGMLLGSMSTRLSATARNEELDETLVELQKAIRQQRKCQLAYISFFERKQIVTALHPYHLHFAQRAWYVIGYSSLHREVRTFKLGRIKKLEPLDKRFAEDNKFRIEEYLGQAWSIIPEGKIYKVKLRFAPLVAANVAEVLWHSRQKIAWHDDGSITYEVEVDGLTEIGWWVLGYGDQVEVLAPAALRKRVAEAARKMVEKYQ
jgi:predicted DNA-binding transcriptional regulator YafY